MFYTIIITLVIILILKGIVHYWKEYYIIYTTDGRRHLWKGSPRSFADVYGYDSIVDVESITKDEYYEKGGL